MPKYEKLLVKRYQGQVTDGKHLIPTQIRNIPGVRNGYKTTICTVNDERKVVQDNLCSWTHSGTIAAFTGNDELNKNMSSENSEQLSGGAPLHVLTLNTKSSLDKADKECVKQTGEAVKKSESNIKSSNIPINIFRALFKGSYKAIEERLHEVSDIVNDEELGVYELIEIKNYLAKDSRGSLKKASSQLDIVGDGDKRKQFFTTAIELKQLLNKYSGILGKVRIFFAGSDNASLEIGRKLVEFEQGLTELKSDERVNQYLDLSQVKEERIHFACKSGRDRTGLVNFVAALGVIKLNLSNMRGEQETTETSKKSEKEVAEKLAKAGHFQYLAGNFGGTPGCVGLKPLPLSIPKSLGREVSSALQLETARFNNSIPKPSFFSRSVIQEKSSLSNKLSTPLTWVKGKLYYLMGRREGYRVTNNQSAITPGEGSVTPIFSKALLRESKVELPIGNNLGITEELSSLLKYGHQLKKYLPQMTSESGRGDFHSGDSDEKISADDRSNLGYGTPFKNLLEKFY